SHAHWCHPHHHRHHHHHPHCPSHRCFPHHRRHYHPSHSSPRHCRRQCLLLHLLHSSFRWATTMPLNRPRPMGPGTLSGLLWALCWVLRTDVCYLSILGMCLYCLLCLCGIIIG